MEGIRYGYETPALELVLDTWSMLHAPCFPISDVFARQECFQGVISPASLARLQNQSDYDPMNMHRSTLVVAVKPLTPDATRLCGGTEYDVPLEPSSPTEGTFRKPRVFKHCDDRACQLQLGRTISLNEIPQYQHRIVSPSVP